jgi:hypothetical protein
MDSKDKLWLSRGESLGRVLSECQRVRPHLVENRPAENRSAVGRFADPLDAARSGASIALAMRKGALCNAKDIRAEAMRAGFRWLVRAVKRRLAPRPHAAPVPIPVPIRLGMRKGR